MRDQGLGTSDNKKALAGIRKDLSHLSTSPYTPVHIFWEGFSDLDPHSSNLLQRVCLIFAFAQSMSSWMVVPMGKNWIIPTSFNRGMSS